jgi:hypothetical protein
VRVEAAGAVGGMAGLRGRAPWGGCEQWADGRRADLEGGKPQKLRREARRHS